METAQLFTEMTPLHASEVTEIGRKAKIKAEGRVEARGAENGGRRPIIWQRSSGHGA